MAKTVTHPIPLRPWVRRVDGKSIMVTCRDCKKDYTLPATDEQIIRYNNGAYVQTAFRHLNADQRELIVSGTCGECFDKMFGGES